jgi:hypothetical protein
MNANIHNEKIVNISLSDKICCNIRPMERSTHKQTAIQTAFNTFMPAFIELRLLLPKYLHSNIIFIVDNYNSLQKVSTISNVKLIHIKKQGLAMKTPQTVIRNGMEREKLVDIWFVFRIWNLK